MFKVDAGEFDEVLMVLCLFGSDGRGEVNRMLDSLVHKMLRSGRGTIIFRLTVTLASSQEFGVQCLKERGLVFCRYDQAEGRLQEICDGVCGGSLH